MTNSVTTPWGSSTRAKSGINGKVRGALPAGLVQTNVISAAAPAWVVPRSQKRWANMSSNDMVPRDTTSFRLKAGLDFWTRLVYEPWITAWQQLDDCELISEDWVAILSECLISAWWPHNGLLQSCKHSTCGPTGIRYSHPGREQLHYKLGKIINHNDVVVPW